MFKSREKEAPADLWVPKQEGRAADPPGTGGNTPWQGSGGAAGASPYGGMFESVVQREASAPSVTAPLGPDELVPSGGGRLDAVVQRKMESALGGDLSDVRIHTDDRRATSMNADAYTVGNDIVFKSGNYDPSSAAGARRLAHELTHVMQQRAGAVSGEDIGNGVGVSDPSDSFERHAEESADRMMGGAPPAHSFSRGGATSGASVQRVVQREDSGEPDYLGMMGKAAKWAVKQLPKGALETLGSVPGKAIDVGVGLGKVAQSSTANDRAQEAQQQLKDAVPIAGPAVVDWINKEKPPQAEVGLPEADSPDVKVKGQLAGDSATINRSLQGEGVGNIGFGNGQVIAPDGTVTGEASGSAPASGAPTRENAGEDPVGPRQDIVDEEQRK